MFCAAGENRPAERVITMDLFEGMLQKDKDEFRRVCNKLMSTCFIVKRNETTRADYYFILRMKPVFERYLDVLGYSLEINEDYGVIQLVNRENYNHLNLRLNDSIILLILRILYDEKKRELSLTDVVVNLGDIQEKYLSLKIREKQIDKTTMGNALRLFKRYNLIEILDRELNQEDSRIIIYDSILMAIRVEDIRRVYELLGKYRDRKQEELSVKLAGDGTDAARELFLNDRMVSIKSEENRSGGVTDLKPQENENGWKSDMKPVKGRNGRGGNNRG